MTNILSIPEEISPYLTFFQKHFSKPQFERFSEHIISRIIDERYTSNRIHKHFFHKVNQSTSNRFLTESPWNEEQIETGLYQLVGSNPNIPNYRIGILDDTLSHKKYAKKMEGVGNHHDHLNNTFSNGHDIVSLGIYTNRGCLPLALKLYVKRKDIVSDVDFKTKNEIAIQTINRIHKHIPLDIMTMDSWYGNNTDLLISLKSQDIHYVAAIKSNRNFTINRTKQFVREYFRSQEWENFDVVNIQQRKFKIHKAKGFMSRLGTVTLLVSQMWDEGEEKWTEPFYIITDLHSKSAQEILEIYLKRNGIEGFHRESKQHLNMESYKLRKYKGIVRNLFLVVLTYVILMLMMFNEEMETTLGKMCEYIKKCCETVSFHTVINIEKSVLFQESTLQNLGFIV